VHSGSGWCRLNLSSSACLADFCGLKRTLVNRMNDPGPAAYSAVGAAEPGARPGVSEYATGGALTTRRKIPGKTAIAQLNTVWRRYGQITSGSGRTRADCLPQETRADLDSCVRDARIRASAPALVFAT